MNSGTRLRHLKHKLFLFGSEQLSAMLSNGLLFVVAKLIELVQLQIVALTVIDNMFPNDAGVDMLYTAANVLMLGSASKTDTGREIRRVCVMAVIFIASLLQIFLICRMHSTLARYKPSYFISVLIKMSAFYIFLFENVLIIPFQSTLMEVYFCEGFDKCLDTTHIIWLAVTIPSQLLLISTLLIDMFLTREDQPESALPWTCFNSMVPYLRLLLKITVSVLRAFGVSWDILPVLTIVVAILVFCILATRWKQGGEHKLWANCVSAFEEIFTLCVHTAIAYIYYAGQDEFELYAAMALSPAFLFTFELARLWREERILKTSLPGQQQSINDVEVYIHRLLSYVRDPADSHNYMRLCSILVLHTEVCENQQCVCGQLKAFTMQRYNAAQTFNGVMMRQNTRANTITAFMESYNQVRDKWYRFVIILAQEALTKFQKVPAMQLQLSYLYLRLFRNCYMALYYAQSASALRPSLALQFEIFHHTRKIESILNFRITKNMSAKRYVVNIERNIEYVVQINIFEESAEACAHDHHQFWSVLLESEPDTAKLLHYGSKITKGISEIRQVYKSIMDITQNNIAFLYKYALFLKNVIHDDIEAYAIITRILNSRELATSNDKRWNCWEGQTSMLRASGDQKSLTQVRDISLECEQLLGYTKRELVGTNLSKLMLHPMSACHDEWIKNFYETMSPKAINTPFVSYVQKKSRHYLQCDVMICIIPNLDSGMQEFAAFLKPNSRSSYLPSYLARNDQPPAIFLCDTAENVIGINEACTQYFGIPVEITDASKHECHLCDIFPEFADASKSTDVNDGIRMKIVPKRVRDKLPAELIEQVCEENPIKQPDSLGDAAIEDSLTTFWGRMVEETYGESTSSSCRIKIAFLLPLGKREELKELGTSVMSKSKRTMTMRRGGEADDEKNNNTNNNPGGPGDDNGSAYGSSCGSSNSSNSTANSEARIIKEFKMKLYERKFPFAVKLINRCMAVIAAVLFIIECKRECDVRVVVNYVLAKIEADGLVNNFELISRATDQYYALVAISTQTREIYAGIRYYFLLLSR